VAAHFLPEPRIASTIWMVNSPHNLALQLVDRRCALSGAAGAGCLAHCARRGGPLARRGTGGPRVALMLALFVGESMVDIVLDFPASIGISPCC
jgi:hypothetical protein